MAEAHTARHILVVEDEDDIAEMIKQILEFEGYTVTLAVAGAALQQIEQQRPALILLDLMMPGMDGYEVGRRLRADPRSATIPIVVMSAGRQAQEGATLINAAASLSKPFDIATLVATVSAHAGPPARTEG